MDAGRGSPGMEGAPVGPLPQRDPGRWRLRDLGEWPPLVAEKADRGLEVEIDPASRIVRAALGATPCETSHVHLEIGGGPFIVGRDPVRNRRESDGDRPDHQRKRDEKEAWPC